MNIFDLSSFDLLWHWLFKVSIQAAVIACIVMVLLWLFHEHLKPKWRYTLWGLVVFRALLPFSIQSATSVFNLWDESVIPYSMHSETIEQVPASSLRNKELDNAMVAVKSENSIAPKVSNPYSNLQKTVKPEQQSAWTVSTVAGIIWLIGAVFVFLISTIKTIRLSGRFTRRRPVTKEQVLNLLEDCKNEFGIFTPITVVESPLVRNPALLGFVRPRLLLPEKIISQLSDDELRCVFYHELAHLKRHDIAANWVIFIAQVLHWFNPVLWLAFRYMRSERELACDEKVLSMKNENSGENYGKTIIKLLESASGLAVIPGAIGITENKNEIKKRLKMIMSFDAKNRRSSVLAMLLLIVLGACCLTNAKPGKSDTKQTSPDEKWSSSALKGTHAENAKIKELEEKLEKVEARALFFCDDGCNIYLNGKKRRFSYGRELDITIQEGDVIAAEAWDTQGGTACGLLAGIRLVASGKTLGTDTSWVYSSKEEVGWEKQDFDDKHWQKVRWSTVKWLNKAADTAFKNWERQPRPIWGEGTPVYFRKRITFKDFE